MISLYVFIDYIYYTLNTTAMYKRININLDVELVKKPWNSPKINQLRMWFIMH